MKQPVDGLLMAAKPADQGNYQDVERLHDMGHCTNRLSVILPNNNIIRLVRVFAPYGLSEHLRVAHYRERQALEVFCDFR